jgi:hypothetical protein
MAIADSQDDNRAFHGNVKQGLPLLQLPRTNGSSGFYGTHLPLAPADTRQDQYLDTRPDARHEQFNTVRAYPNHLCSSILITHLKFQ